MYASEAGDREWGYEAILELYRSRVEDWAGVPDPSFYGTGGAMHVEPVEHPDSFSLAMLDAAHSCGLKRFQNSGGQMTKAEGGCAIVDNINHDGKRQSAYRSYVYPRLLQSNLTVLTGALVTRPLRREPRNRHRIRVRRSAPPSQGNTRDRPFSRRYSDAEAAYAVRDGRPERA